MATKRKYISMREWKDMDAIQHINILMDDDLMPEEEADTSSYEPKEVYFIRTHKVRSCNFRDLSPDIPNQNLENFDPDDANNWEHIDFNEMPYGKFFAVHVKGDSMHPKMCDGDTLIVRAQNSVNDGEIAIVTYNNHASCKKVHFADNGIYLLPLNNHYYPIFFSRHEIQNLDVKIIGKVVEVRSEV